MEGVVVMFFMFGISLSHSVTGNAQHYFDVGKFGAVGDGKTDDSPAFLKAWEAVCGARGETATLKIPADKIFLLYPLEFAGPCKSSSIHIQFLGKILAPSADERGKFKSVGCWLCFMRVDGLIVDGPGQIDGNGATWWTKVLISERPTALLFHLCNDLRLSGLTHLNSQNNHISIHSCSGVSISNLHIIAPSDSPNTDGIVIALSTQLLISNTFIGTGDDCIAIKGGTSNINITSVTCGPGHGISIGSLGEDGTNQNVDQVYVTGCTFKGSTNGARIKTTPGGTGYARGVSFQGITLIASGNPIVIDQHYCNGLDHHCQDQKKAVAINGVTFSGFQGTSSVVEAINLDCSKQGCRGITIDNVNISSSVGQDLRAVCNNAHGTSASTVPVVSCLLS
ncbi:hypothetical protein V6N11_057706 [Hibiscus sabdariffa]|uniref:Polygalacturonase n=2 Tax=Hibiscus sabdariffa TaxID=183260 RepID=A0ABR2BG10_9ROSI